MSEIGKTSGKTSNELGDEDIAEDLEALKTDIEDRVDRLSRNADNSTRRVLSEIQDGISQLYDELSAEGSRAVEAIEQSVEEHPWTSLFVGFGIGCLVGQFLFRRR